MKVSIDELKKAVKWVEANSNATAIKVHIINDSTSKLYIDCDDKYGSSIEIVLYEDGTMLPKIKRTEVL